MRHLSFRRFDAFELLAAWNNNYCIAHLHWQDPLLSYLLHARNVDEHGLVPVTSRHAGMMRFVGAEPMDAARPGAGVRVTLDIRDPHVALESVRDRGIDYPVPTSFRGASISAAHPQNIGLLGLSYAEEIITGARTQLNPTK